MASLHPPRPLAVVTGASSGIGRELAQLAAQDGHDLVIVADQGDLEGAARSVRAAGPNAGHGPGQGFRDKPFAESKHVIDTNITGTLDVLYRVGSAMRQRGQGR